VHSNRSPDSFAFGNSRLTPDNAYRFAKGETVKANSGENVTLKKPLDFLLVADHAEFVGVFPKLIERDPVFAATGLGKRWIKALDESANLRTIILEWVALISDPNYEQELTAEFRTDVWKENISFADRHNDPGTFTAMIGYEWTAMINGNNLHRVIVYRDNVDKAGQLPPFSALDSQDPEKLWAFLEQYEAKTGGDIMAIPHNGNISNGMMFQLNTVSGEPVSEAWAQTRIKWEPLYEVTQVKGDGEAHPFLSPDDEFADYETWDEDNIGRTVAKKNEMLQYEYGRSALKLGLKVEQELGTNPYEFGLLGSTDSHTTLSTADDDNFYGKFIDSEMTPERMTNKMGGSLWYNWKLAASGYMGIWADENNRTSLFDAMQRKEVYATTGPRIALRFFGSWHFNEQDSEKEIATVGYQKGVPMGSRLIKAPKGGAPRFLISAYKDADGANLDRMQVIKGYLAEDGELKERIYEVAFAGKRKIDDLGKLPPIGNTVDVADASYTNSIGATSLDTLWEDPDFNPKERAFYYVRVLEIPTPRWSAYDVKKFDLIDVNENVPMVTQERVYSSPIWYSPSDL
jgi:hypothetical protein|tara:strand:- start:2297 stop:4015 length:1719 start_codon:yes stop_codon:yes gene_type:complete